MLTIDIGFLEKLGSALLLGDDGLLKRAVKAKLRQLSKEMLNELTGGLPSEVIRAGRQAQRPFNQMRRQWLGLGEGEDSEQSIYEQLIGAVEKGGSTTIRRGIRAGEKQQGWRQSRQYWLGEDWRHDWRSQPRDPHGRWTEGRLRHPYVSKGARRMRLARRRASRKAFQQQREEQ